MNRAEGSGSGEPLSVRDSNPMEGGRRDGWEWNSQGGRNQKREQFATLGSKHFQEEKAPRGRNHQRKWWEVGVKGMGKRKLRPFCPIYWIKNLSCLRGDLQYT